MPEETKRFQCRHIFTDGRRCGSPCLRKPGGHGDFCYYHHTARRPAKDVGRSRRRTTTFTLPLMEDRSAIQHSIGQVLQKLAQNELDPRRAGLLLYGLQIASLNLPPQKRLEPAKDAETVEEITTDTKVGTLAPDAELVPPPEEKNSARELLEEWNRREDPQARYTLPSIQAVAGELPAFFVCHPSPQAKDLRSSLSPRLPVTGTHPHRKSTPNPRPCKTLRKKLSRGTHHAAALPKHAAGTVKHPPAAILMRSSAKPCRC